MALRFVYGDSYGGVQGAEQGYDQMRDARYFNSLAVQDRRRQQAAQEAMERARLEEAAESRALSLFLNQSEMANRNRQFDVGSGQWEREFGLRSRIADESVAERAARSADTLADREAQRGYQYDALRSSEADREAQRAVERDKLGAQTEHYRALESQALAKDQADVLKSALDVSSKGVVWGSPDEVAVRYPSLTRSQAQVVFDLSQVKAKEDAEDLRVATALSKATERRRQLPELIKSTKAAQPWDRGLPLGLTWNPLLTLNKMLPGSSISSRLGQQLRDFETEDTKLRNDMESLQLRLDYPQRITANPASAQLPIPRTIIPVSAGPESAPASVPISSGFVVGRVYSGRGGPRVYLGGPITSPSSWGNP